MIRALTMPWSLCYLPQWNPDTHPEAGATISPDGETEEGQGLVLETQRAGGPALSAKWEEERCPPSLIASSLSAPKITRPGVRAGRLLGPTRPQIFPPPCLLPHLSAAAAPLLAVHPSFQGWWAGLRGEHL